MDIWTEKYRPGSLEDVVNQRHVVDRLKEFVKNKSIPHMLFAGPPGVGKTASAIALVKDLYGEKWHQNFQELNASDDRGINVVRTRIKEFARIKPIDAPFKIIFLDESDALTTDAQQALRRTIEQYSGSCRFILSCNYSSKIISPIQSRCSVFRFKPLEKADVVEYLKRIIKAEKLSVDSAALDAIFELSEGDMRMAVNLLQSSASFGEKITSDSVYEVASQAKPKDVKVMLDFAVKGDFKSARKKLHELVLKQGLAGEDIISACHREVYNLELSEEKKVEFISKMGEYDFRISEGGDPIIQLEAMLAQFMISSKKQ
ncbi:Replication factor C small subunit [Candidatus Micrarchaeota archaeon RBG_16_49_10]|nr:MAG: Replication factor C small subunit [Candidatus Micrarchaeota archaeon RBG_16_49_10]